MGSNAHKRRKRREIEKLAVVGTEPAPHRACCMTTISLARLLVQITRFPRSERESTWLETSLTLILVGQLMELFDWISAGKELASFKARQGNSFEINPASFGVFGAMFVFDVSLH